MSSSENSRSSRARRFAASLRDGTLHRIAARAGDLLVWGDMRAFPPLAVSAGLLCVAGLLLTRRVADPASLRLTGTQLSVMATVAAVLSLGARAILARIEVRPPATWLRWMAALVAALPLATLTFGSSRPISAGTIGYIVALTGLVGLAALVWSREAVERMIAAFLLPPTIDRPVSTFVQVQEPLRHKVELSPAIEWNDTPVPASRKIDPPLRLHSTGAMAAGPPVRPVSSLKRTIHPEGNDRIEGSVSTEFAAGQTLTTIHIPFLPTFPRAPELRCEIADAAQVRIKAMAVFPYGARLELKRTGDASAPARVEVGIRATLVQPLARAA